MPGSALRTLLIITAAVAAACSPTDDARIEDDKVLNVYNWADYVAPDTLANFEAEYGIRINYDIYDSSEVVDVKLLTGNTGYDIVFHSHQFSERLMPVGVYQPIDYKRLQNYSNIDPDVFRQLDLYENIRGYAVPYHWGTTGFAWNIDMVRERLPDHPMDSSDVLFDPDVVRALADCGVSLLDGASDLFPMTLAYLGLDPNSTQEQDILAAEETLASVKPYIRYFSNQKMISDLPNREVCVAMSWSGDYAQAAARGQQAGVDVNLAYTIPREGSRLWIDGIFIPSDAPHVDNAYLFLDYLLRADVAADIANSVYYANANGASWPMIDDHVINDPSIFPDAEVWERIFAAQPLDPKAERFITRAFARVKSGL